MVTLKYLYLYIPSYKTSYVITITMTATNLKLFYRPFYAQSQEMFADFNIPAVSALLLSLEFKFVPIFKKNTDDASIWNKPFHFLHNTHDKLSPQLSNRFAIDYNRYIGKGRVIEHVQLSCLHRQLFLRPYLGSHREHSLFQLLRKIEERYHKYIYKF